MSFRGGNNYRLKNVIIPKSEVIIRGQLSKSNSMINWSKPMVKIFGQFLRLWINLIPKFMDTGIDCRLREV